MKNLLAALTLILLLGCATTDAIDLVPYVASNDVNKQSNLLILRTHTVLGDDDRSYSYDDMLNIQPNTLLIKDRFIDNDVQALKDIVARNDYGVINIRSINDLHRYVNSTQESTKTLLLVIGEGEPFRFCPLILKFKNGNSISGVKIYYKSILEQLNECKGSKCVLIGACQAGSALECVPVGFKGVIIASAPKGYATTPCEASGHTAFFTEILNHIEDDLSSCELGNAGTFINGMRHKWVDFWSGNNLPISYIIERFANDEFKLGR